MSYRGVINAYICQLLCFLPLKKPVDVLGFRSIKSYFTFLGSLTFCPYSFHEVMGMEILDRNQKIS